MAGNSNSGRTIGKRHQDDIRAKIQAAHIHRRLMANFDGELELTDQQIKIGMFLLNKCLPELKAMELSGPDGGSIDMHWTVKVVDA